MTQVAKKSLALTDAIDEFDAKIYDCRTVVNMVEQIARMAEDADADADDEALWSGLRVVTRYIADDLERVEQLVKAIEKGGGK